MVVKYENEINDKILERNHIILKLKNKSFLAFTISDKTLWSDILKRVTKDRKGILKIGEKKENKVDLNMVETIIVNRKII